MGNRKTWIICSHVMNGSADTVTLSPNGLCVCDRCVEDVSRVQTAEVHIVEEDRLVGMLKDIENVHGKEHIT